MSRLLGLLLAVAAVATGCSSEVLVAGDGPFDPDELYDPTEAGEDRPDGYRESLPRDVINPVYEPVFVAASVVEWPDDELVIGVEIEGEARAYPVGFLTWREIVNDRHRGIPTLVTW